MDATVMAEVAAVRAEHRRHRRAGSSVRAQDGTIIRHAEWTYGWHSSAPVEWLSRGLRSSEVAQTKR